jgi:hypothetical protein
VSANRETVPEPGDGSDLAALRRIALSLPGVQEGTSYGTPAFRASGKFFLRMWEDGETMVLKTDFYERDFLLQADPAAFFTTDHYRDYPSVLVRLPRVPPARLRELLVDAWRRVAPKRAVARFDAEAGPRA